ncbi:MAG: hypothetical protein H3C31_13885 [Brumimicrobium sp.]|nr:hypothetical protein [Brumimicrobium sp.]
MLIIAIIGSLLFSFNLSNDSISHVDKVDSDFSHVIDDDSLIVWSTDRKLEWSDFLGIPDTVKFKRFKAISANGYFDIKNKIKGDSIEVFIYCYFDRYKSWSIWEDKELLNHEQRHFDLAEVIVRKFRKRVSNYPLKNENSFWYWYRNVALNEYLNEKSYYQLYDKETNHGTIIEIQQKWDKKIDDMLEELKDYSNPRVVVRKKDR